MSGTMAKDGVQPETARVRTPHQGIAGRFVLLCDSDGRRHAVARHAVSALCEEDGTTIVLLPGGRVVALDLPLEEVMDLLSSVTS